MMRIPFRGMALASSSVTLLSLLGYYSHEKKQILKSTMLVILVKFIISPYTPLTAYLAVTFQGVSAYVLYGKKKMFKLSVFFHAVISQVQSSLQKFITLTLFFGMTFWHSLDLYIDYIAEKFGLLSNKGGDISYSFMFAAFYVFIHAVAGVITGIAAGKLPAKLEQEYSGRELSAEIINQKFFSEKRIHRKRKFWWQRKSGIILILIFMAMALLPFIDPSLEENITGNVIYMVVRAVIITFVWFVMISPVLIKYIRKFLRKKESVYFDELNEIIDLIPLMKSLGREKWDERKEKGLRTIPSFLLGLFSTLLFFSTETDKVKIPDQKETVYF